MTNPYCCNFYFTTVGIFFTVRSLESCPLDRGGNQTDFRQGTELLDGSQRERDRRTPFPD